MSAVSYQTSNTLWYFVLMDPKDLLVVVTGTRSDVTQSEEEKGKCRKSPISHSEPQPFYDLPKEVCSGDIFKQTTFYGKKKLNPHEYAKLFYKNLVKF